ncbi:hypothetical protein [Flavobacterium sp.]|uniref:hypothetical protein n=1 Tax=Flavobacterium sp. TaxID=239 RepID=UPI003D139505
MKNLLFILGFSVLATSFIACNKDNDDQLMATTDSAIKITAKATYTGNKTAKLASTLSLSSIKVNLKEIKFHYEGKDSIETHHSGDDDHDGFFDGDDNFKLKGPFEVELLNGPVDFIATDIPKEVYSDIRFKLDKSKNSASELFNKSIQIKGKIIDKPFVFWHFAEDDFRIDFANAADNVIIGDNLVTITFDFNLDEALSKIDLSKAKDGNGDGIIEISPLDPDGNQSIAHQFKDLIKKSCHIKHGNDDSPGHD